MSTRTIVVKLTEQAYLALYGAAEKRHKEPTEQHIAEEAATIITDTLWMRKRMAEAKLPLKSLPLPTFRQNLSLQFDIWRGR